MSDAELDFNAFAWSPCGQAALVALGDKDWLREIWDLSAQAERERIERERLSNQPTETT